MREKTLVIAALLSLGLHGGALALGMVLGDGGEKLPMVTVVELISLSRHPGREAKACGPGNVTPARALEAVKKKIEVEEEASKEGPMTKVAPEKASSAKPANKPDAPLPKKTPNLEPSVENSRFALRKSSPLSKEVSVPLAGESREAATAAAKILIPGASAPEPKEAVGDGLNWASQKAGVAGKVDLSGVPVAYADNPPPRYPHLARRRGWQGLVWLQVWVSEKGQVVDVRIEKSCGHEILDRAALDAVRNWRFEPARKGLLKAAGEARVPVRFELLES